MLKDIKCRLRRVSNADVEDDNHADTRSGAARVVRLDVR